MEFSDLWDVQFSGPKPVTAAVQKTGGIEVLHDEDKDKAVLMCNTSDSVFGPLIMGSNHHHQAATAGEAAEKFLQWHIRTFGDPRRADESTLAQRLYDFGRKFHGFRKHFWGPDKGKDSCETCSLPAAAHAENKACQHCSGTGEHPDPDPMEVSDWAEIGKKVPCPKCDGAGKPNFDEENEFDYENDQPER